MATRKNKLIRLAKNQLKEALNDEQIAFDKWIGSTRSAKSSTQDDLPSLNIPGKTDHIKPDVAQIFAIIDTCSLVKYRLEIMEFVTRLKTIFPRGKIPIKFILSLVVLEELDKCNRRSRTANNGSNSKHNDPNTQSVNTPLNQIDDENVRDIREAIARGVYSEPPRLFMRFIEEETRAGDVIISEFDPYRQLEMIRPFEIINKDDRILDCAIRSQAFIERVDHHPETKLILVTEDNIFKTKATTFQIVSFRWLEFSTKFKNFGLDHYVTTPQIPLITLNSSLLAPEDFTEPKDLIDKTPKVKLLKQRKKTKGDTRVSVKRRRASSDVMIVEEIINLV